MAGDAVEIGSLVASAIEAVATAGRDDLRDRLQMALDRALRPATVICVVGEFKQGKSSLVNALLGRTVCPVDDDLATSAVTLVHHRPEPAVVVRRRLETGELSAERIPTDDLADVVTERGNPNNERQIDRVEIGFPHPLLATGLAVVDTPGMGGLGAGHAAATVAYLPFADGLLFVTDASAELSRSEVDFLKQAVAACPTVVFCLSKTDVYGEWRRLLEIDRGHLQTAGLDLPMLSLSASLRTAALKRKNDELDKASGYPDLLRAINGDVVAPAKERAAARALDEVAGALQQILGADEQELQQLVDPERAAVTLASLAAAQDRLGHLRGPGARWQQLLNDGIADLTGEVTHQFRASMRTINRDADEALEVADSSAEWETLIRKTQSDVAIAVAAVFAQVEAGATRLGGLVVEVLQSEEFDLTFGATSVASIGSKDLWASSMPKSRAKSGASNAAGQGMAMLQGMSTGAMILGAMTRVLPAAAAGLLALNPVVVGVGLLVGGQRALDHRKRKVATQRQQARVALRQFSDDIQFEIGTELTNTLRSVQRQLRDEFTSRVAELQRSCSEAVERMQAVASSEATERAARQAVLEARIDATARLLERCHAIAQ